MIKIGPYGISFTNLPDFEKDVNDISISNDIPILQEANSSSYYLRIDLMELDNIRYYHEDIVPEDVDNVDELLRQTRVITMNDFLVNDDDFEDDTLEEYNDKEMDVGSRDSDSCAEQDETSSDEDN
ncbi:hypothetical protein PanWU01x14_198240 [Parasponia andersonii]|uniref:Uncharacterized protein n=1 Tax=Parasponia andersonii TaxID=3476 RepID=A0A2P5BZ68_PARAD|nr:hypothetical protein PanWU01x14_198240 [Parasponia andersonii]